ncbi:MAG TPA: META domain-containing protein [Dongiaceae bacterium]
MFFSAARGARRLVGQLACALLALLAAGASAARAADHAFPYDGVLQLEAKSMKGSKRVPILQIESNGAAAFDLWCNKVAAQLIVVDDTITILLGARTERQCEPDRMQADGDLIAALQQVASWRRDGDLLLLQGERSLRFHLSSN